ncbi:MAG: GerMN domain-containing protein [Candidatus Eremiobacteraeota bacterium]|nr:GerMN domain-containing protein [Candidatus Eremiobacteraeota bacterium]MBC5826086.1 GerMN domain-containing protein [Candidatus Eremiobacteraeota bacterium]
MSRWMCFWTAIATCIVVLSAGCSRRAQVAMPRQITLYYCKAGSGALVPMKYTADAAMSGSALENYAVDQLLSGPAAGQDALVLFPAGTRAVVTQSGGTAIVDLKGPLTRPLRIGASDEIALFKSLTYTLTDLPAVKNVQVLIDGHRSAVLPGGGFELDEPLTRETFAQ